ncbi:hypothetical protein [Candidatus Solirubrobacter pratensis]|nr:hypothetical protein [Candidatus Solirubrobacter pratensis]
MGARTPSWKPATATVPRSSVSDAIARISSSGAARTIGANAVCWSA